MGEPPGPPAAVPGWQTTGRPWPSGLRASARAAATGCQQRSPTAERSPSALRPRPAQVHGPGWPATQQFWNSSAPGARKRSASKETKADPPAGPAGAKGRIAQVRPDTPRRVLQAQQVALVIKVTAGGAVRPVRLSGGCNHQGPERQRAECTGPQAQQSSQGFPGAVADYGRQHGGATSAPRRSADPCRCTSPGGSRARAAHQR